MGNADRTFLRVQASMDRRAASLRDTGAKHELSECELVALVNLAHIGIDFLMHKAVTNRKQSRDFLAQCHARAVLVSTHLGGEGPLQDREIRFAADGMAICDRFEQLEITPDVGGAS